MKNRPAYWWMELVLGVLLCVFGVYILSNPNIALSGIVVIFGIFALLTGIADIALYFRLERRTGFGPTTSLIAGIFSIIAGALLMFNIGAGRFIISLFIPLWFIAHCVSRLSNLTLTRIAAGRTVYYISLVVNILGLVLAFALLFNPAASAAAVGYIIGFYLLILGVGSLVSTLSK